MPLIIVTVVLEVLKGCNSGRSLIMCGENTSSMSNQETVTSDIATTVRRVMGTGCA